jgi:hypothetical protein
MKERHSAQKLADSQLAMEQEINKTEELQLTIIALQQQLQSLEVVLREKNREIYALERLVGRQKAISTSENVALYSLSTENQRIRGSIPNPDPAIPGQDRLSQLIQSDFLTPNRKSL